MRAASTASPGEAKAGSSRLRSWTTRAARASRSEADWGASSSSARHSATPSVESLGVLHAPQLAAQRVLLAVLQPRRVELAHLKAEQVLPLSPVSLRRAQPVGLLLAARYLACSAPTWAHASSASAKRSSNSS